MGLSVDIGITHRKEGNPLMRQSLGEQFATVLTTVKRLVYLLIITWRSAPWLALILLFTSAVRGTQPVARVWIGKLIIDIIIRAMSVGDASGLVRQLLFLVIIQLLLVEAMQVVLWAERISIRIGGQLVSNNITKEIMDKASYTAPSFFDDPRFSNALGNAKAEAAYRPVAVLTSSITLLSSIVTLSGFVTVLARFHVGAMMIVVAGAVPSAFISFRYANKAYEIAYRQTGEKRKMAYYSELLVGRSHVNEARIYSLHSFIVPKYLKVFADHYRQLVKLSFSEGWWNILASVISGLAEGSVYLWVVLSALHGRITIGELSLYAESSFMVGVIVANIISSMSMIYEGTLFIENLRSFLSAETALLPINTPAHTIHMRSCGHCIEFKNVSFRYPGSDRFALRNVSLKINAGETIALVGGNGAGKTTLLKLIMRFYDPSGGSVLLDGIDIRSYDVDKLWSLFSVVFQDFGRYALSLKENISLCEVVDPNRFLEATARTGVDSIAQTFSHQYDTQLSRLFDPSGTELSGGQWQKVALARAVYREAGILILDEPTSSLDAEAEHEILSLFDKIKKNRTAIIVSHRLSSVTRAHRIFVLEAGVVMESGSHCDLLKAGGRYAKLFQMQAEKYKQTLDAI